MCSENCKDTTSDLDCKCGGCSTSCSCIIYDTNVALNNIKVNPGDSLCEALASIDEVVNSLIQVVEESTDSNVEVSRGDGVPSGEPATGDPIIYINETTGDIYIWDKTNTIWVLKGTVSITSADDSFSLTSTLANVKAKINVTNNPDGSVTLKTIYTNGNYVQLGAASSGINVAFPDMEPSLRKRWDGFIEFDGEFSFNSPYTLLGTGASRTISLTTIPTGYRPPNFKKFPAWLKITVDSGSINFPGQIEIDKTTGLMTFTVLACGNKRELVVNECGMSWETFTEVEDLVNNTANYDGAFIHINHIGYYL